MRLEGKRALVTGSSSGIGEAIALRFAREGADVAVHYHREEDEAQRVAAEIQKMGRQSVALGANVGVAAEAEKLVRDAHAALGGLDILVNNAGVEIREPFVEVSEQHYDLVLDVNLKGAFFAAQAAAKLMIAAGTGGRIVNVSSIHEDIAFLQYATYTASKGGMRMLTRTICQELAPHGITVNDIAPGAIATPINKRTLGDGELLHALQEVIPSGRLGEPDEVAGVAVFLASDEAAYVTGSTYYIDGGMARWNKGL
ncbi:MAG TPA: glucose 1-dehydrogenase [Thermoleophilia bacterium]|nr:glucose 1-dehydrogenase [Thermoleophilia bacterium]